MTKEDILMLEIKGQKAILEAANKQVKKKKRSFFANFLKILTNLFTIK
jgi:hypothetical protein